MDAELERRLAGRAAPQSGLITRRQLLSIGLSDRQVDGCIRRGRLVALHRGVYLVAGAPLDDAVWLKAATLATSGTASHRSAAHLLGLIDSPPSRPEITIPATGGVRAPFIIHRSADRIGRERVNSRDATSGLPSTLFSTVNRFTRSNSRASDAASNGSPVTNRPRRAGSASEGKTGKIPADNRRVAHTPSSRGARRTVAPGN